MPSSLAVYPRIARTERPIHLGEADLDWLIEIGNGMLTEIYIEALLVDGKLADQVWEAWDAGEIDDVTAWYLWWAIGYV